MTPGAVHIGVNFLVVVLREPLGVNDQCLMWISTSVEEWLNSKSMFRDRPTIAIRIRKHNSGMVL